VKRGTANLTHTPPREPFVYGARPPGVATVGDPGVATVGDPGVTTVGDVVPAGFSQSVTADAMRERPRAGWHFCGASASDFFSGRARHSRKRCGGDRSSTPPGFGRRFRHAAWHLNSVQVLRCLIAAAASVCIATGMAVRGRLLPVHPCFRWSRAFGGPVLSVVPCFGWSRALGLPAGSPRSNASLNRISSLYGNLNRIG
jgi:hypothetical protein